MTNKLHTSQKTQEIFNSLGQSLRLQPFILSKLAIALSVRKGQLQADDFKTDNNGLELSRQVIFGDHDLLFKERIQQNLNESLESIWRWNSGIESIASCRKIVVIPSNLSLKSRDRILPICLEANDLLLRIIRLYG